MTYKYYEVRRQIYENCSDKSLTKYRTFSDMKKLYKKSFWGILVFMLLCMVGTIVMSLAQPKTPYILVPIVGMVALNIYSEINSEKLYVPFERKKELSERSQSYSEYIKSIKSALTECGLTEKSQYKALKTECEKSLNEQDKRYSSANNKVFDMLIGVPVGALISALIYKGGDEIVTEITILIVVGLMIIAVIKAIKKLRYYSDGHFKDQYLLNALNELEYSIDE